MNTPSRPDPSTNSGTVAERDDRHDWITLQLLTEKLRSVEQRLGTSEELADDERMAQELGHDIRNRLNLLQMREEFRKMMLGKDRVLQRTA